MVSRAHKNIIPTTIPMLPGLTCSMAITCVSIGVAITAEVNTAVGGQESGSTPVAMVCLHSYVANGGVN